MIRLERLQRVAFWIAVTGAALGFLTSAGCTFGPAIPGPSLVVLHPLLVLLGAVAGYLAVGRGIEIDRERWRVVEDADLTHGERDYAHKHAERQRRSASTSFLAAPLMLGYWLAYQVEGSGRDLAAQLLPVSALLGSIIGWFVGRWSAGRSSEESGREPAE